MIKAVFFVAMLAFAAASCPNSCSGHGRCGEWDQCTCFYRWMGNDCSQRMCKEGLAWVDGSQSNPHDWAECSNKGICNRESGECECYDQYDGAACERSVCPNDCSGHGQCEYIHELSDWDSTNWDYWKIQGCRCDGDWTGTDCSKRICPWGDDPLTIPTTSLLGDTYTLTVNQNGSHVKVAEMNLEIVDLNGVTHRSRPFNHDTEPVDGTDLISAADFEELLLDIPAIHAVDNVAVAEVADDTTYTYSFRLVAPLRLTDLRVSWKDECTVGGCYPLRAPMSPPDNELIMDVDVSITTPADVLAESAECSNRGICDYDTGMCQCFEGHYGLACERQTILV